MVRMMRSKNKKSPYEIKDLPIKDIAPDPLQPRDLFDDDKINALAESIKNQGLLQPILVRPLKDRKYKLVHGERRYRACTLLHLKTIKAEIRRLNDNEVLEIQIVENLQREDLNPIEEAKAFQRMHDELKYTHEKIAERIGKSREFVTNKLRLLTLSTDIQKGVAIGKISEGHAKAILSLKDVKMQRQVSKQISNKKLNVRETEQMVQSLRDKNVPHGTLEKQTSKKDVSITSLAVWNLIITEDGELKKKLPVDKLILACIADLKQLRRIA